MLLRHFLVENLILRLEDHLKHRPSRHFLNEARLFSFQTAESIDKLQLEKVRLLMVHAYEHVPFYKTRFDNCRFDPYNISDKSDLEIIPPLTRKDLQMYFSDDLRADNYNPNQCYVSKTGGSTGKPVSFMRDNKCLAIGTAASYAGWEMSGWSLGEPTLTIWGNPTTVKNHWEKPSSRLKAFLSNQYRFPAYELKSADAFKKLTALLFSAKPKYITGYTRAIFLLAEYLRKENISLDFQVKGVLTTAETIFDNQRESIQSSLGPVYDCYGCGEIHSIAYQCSPGGNYHIMDWHVLVQYESTPDINESTLLITDLDNYAFPLIRYRNGDLAIPSNSTSCNCGRNSSQLKRISGRTSDIIQTKSGGYFVVPSLIGISALREAEGILEYQFVQTLSGVIQMRIRANENFKNVYLKLFKDYLIHHISSHDVWDVRTDLPIIYSKSGKAKILHREEKSKPI